GTRRVSGRMRRTSWCSSLPGLILLFEKRIYKFQDSIFRYINFPSNISSVDTPGIKPNPQTEQRTCQQQPNCMRRWTIRRSWPSSLQRCEAFSSVQWRSPCTSARWCRSNGRKRSVSSPPPERPDTRPRDSPTRNFITADWSTRGGLQHESHGAPHNTVIPRQLDQLLS